MAKAEKADGRVYREKTCPLFLRVFCGNCCHNSINDYSRGNTPVNELQIHTWLDATLRELASLVMQVDNEARRRGTMFDFAIVSADSRSPGYRMRDIGNVCSGFSSDADKIMLKDCSFRIGDMIDVAVTPPANQPNAFGAPRRLQRNLMNHLPPEVYCVSGGLQNFASTAAMMSMTTAAAAAAALAGFSPDSVNPRRPRDRIGSRQNNTRRLIKY